jgi:hypothetical protein
MYSGADTDDLNWYMFRNYIDWLESEADNSGEPIYASLYFYFRTITRDFDFDWDANNMLVLQSSWSNNGPSYAKYEMGGSLYNTGSGDRIWIDAAVYAEGNADGSENPAPGSIAEMSKIAREMEVPNPLEEMELFPLPRGAGWVSWVDKSRNGEVVYGDNTVVPTPVDTDVKVMFKIDFPNVTVPGLWKTMTIPASPSVAGAPKISVSNASARPGTEFKVNVYLENNPGIMGAKLELTYGEGLTYVEKETEEIKGIKFSDLEMTQSGPSAGTKSFTFDAEKLTDEDSKVRAQKGVILVLTFVLDENVEPGTEIPIEVKIVGNVYNENNNAIRTLVYGGTVTAVDYMPGNVGDAEDQDEAVDTLDVILMRKYVAGNYGVEIDERVGDVNKDDKVNTNDITLLRRFIAEGYDVVLR